MSILNNVASQLTSLAATNSVCVAFGTTFTLGTNLSLYSQISNDVSAITIYPYGGSPPNNDKYRLNSNFQIKMKSESNHTLMETQQKLIEYLHLNQLSGVGQIKSLNSAPIMTEVLEGGQFKTAVTNYSILHIKQ